MSGVYLAFDFGTRRIGVAVADAVTRSARPLGIVPNEPARIRNLVEEWTPVACIVGLPAGGDRGEQPVARRVRAFARMLERELGMTVHLCDESYSTRSALDELRSARAAGVMKRRVKRGDRDSAAARLILDQWLAEKKNP